MLLITPSILFAKFQVGDFYYEQISPDVREVRLVGLANNEVLNVIIPTKIHYNGVTFKVSELGNSCFAKNTNIFQITIPEGIKVISSYFCSGCSNLKFVSLPTSIVEFGENAFSGCSGLTSVTIPNSVTKIGNNAFSGCTNLESVFFRGEVQHEISFGYCIFYGCSKLKDFPFSKLNIKTIGINAFSITSITHLEINGTPTIGESAFRDCTKLRTITFYSNVGGIGTLAFMGCPIDTIYSYSETPNDLCDIGLEPLKPYVRFIVDDQIYKNKTVAVPEDCIDAYKARLGWRVFENYLDILETGVHSVKAQAQSLKVSSPSSCALRVSGLKPNETVRCYTTTGNLLCEYKAKSNEANLTLPVFSGNIVIVKAGTRSAKVRMR